MNHSSLPFSLFLLLLVGLGGCQQAPEAAVPETEAAESMLVPDESLVRVFVTTQPHNFRQPWQKAEARRSQAVGAVVAGERVLVTGNLVADATFIEIEPPEGGSKVIMEVEEVDYEANLAVLRPQGEAGFLADCRPLEIEGAARKGDPLSIWQIEDNGDLFPVDGTITKVSMDTYFLPGSFFLVYEVKAAFANKTGSLTVPVLKDGKLAGILLGYSAQNETATVLPASMIDRFLTALDEGGFPGIPTIGITYSRTEDPQFRTYLGLREEVGGVFVSNIVKDSVADLSGLAVGDVIVQIDEHPIDKRGFYDHPEYGRLQFSHWGREVRGVGDTLILKIVRDGELMEKEVELTRKEPEEYLIDPYVFDRGPRFLMLGGALFQELTRNYLVSFGKDWRDDAPFDLLYALSNPDEFEEGREKLVFLSYVIPTPATVGYEGLNSLIVTKVNGQTIASLATMKEALAQPINGIHTIEFEDSPNAIHLDAALVERINQALQQQGVSPLERVE
ncbi:MAG: PDZ domain-containing protein [Verrucomicrobiota bacterium]